MYCIHLKIHSRMLEWRCIHATTNDESTVLSACDLLKALAADEVGERKPLAR
jgi:hypothetical protein